MLPQTRNQTMVERVAKNNVVRRCLAGGVVLFFWIVPPQIRALADDGPLQKAVNYLFTGGTIPKLPPKFWIENHALLSCQIRNPNNLLDII